MGRLGVIATQVVHRRGLRGDATEGRMGAVGVVVTNPAREGRKALGVTPVETPIGPLGEEGFDEPFGLAVGLGPVGLGALVASLDRWTAPA